MQIVYLSIRPDVMRDTWRHVRHFMPWVDRAVVVAPARLHPDFVRTLGGDRDRVELVADERLGVDRSRFTAAPHVQLNVSLRRALVESGRTDDVFLLSDDDYRPLRPVPPEYFTEDGRDHGYWFGRLEDWDGDVTDYDKAQHVTRETLAHLGFPTLAFGSHMPQIMRRDLWVEVFDTFSSVRGDNVVCEWALYFNMAPQLHPDRFGEPRPFETLCWPQYGAEWRPGVDPPRWTFENFYPDLYGEGRLFPPPLHPGLDPSTVDRDNLTKITTWTEFARRARRREFTPGVYDPWTRDRALRRLYFRALRLEGRAAAKLRRDRDAAATG